MAAITVTVSRSGQVEIAAHGAQGATCQTLTKPFEEALGKVTQDVAKFDRVQIGVGVGQVATVNAGGQRQ